MVELANINSVWASLVVEELVRNGVRYVCVAPGSRSAPLVVAVAQHKLLKSVVHFDERGAAFYALGYARATGTPAAVICTSGTAVANCLPAVIEASTDMIPLIILSADRPPELHDTGANQTIRQSRIFTEYTRWECELPCPDIAINPRFVLTTIDQAVNQAGGYPNGPVHVNCHFREPLAPIRDGVDYAPYLHDLESWRSGDRPYTHYHRVVASAPKPEIDRITQLCNSAKRPLLVVGGLRNESDRRAALDLATRLQWPTLTDITSGIRLGSAGKPFIHAYDLLLGALYFTETNRPDLCLQIGGCTVSKRLDQFLQTAELTRYIRVADHPFRHDPAHMVTDRIESDIAAFCRAVLNTVEPPGQTDWLHSWCNADAMLSDTLAPLYDPAGELAEPALAHMISRLLPESTALFLASSMPIRDMNAHAAPGGATVPVGANRGASGIDGTVASAIGYAVGLNCPLTLVIGDVAFLHDLNSLALLRSISIPITIVLINNNGGNIFSLLPIADFEALCETYFVAPHSLTFSAVAEQFGVAYSRVASMSEFVAKYKAANASGESCLLEVTIDGQRNRAFRALLTEKIGRTLGKV